MFSGDITNYSFIHDDFYVYLGLSIEDMLSTMVGGYFSMDLYKKVYFEWKGIPFTL